MALRRTLTEHVITHRDFAARIGVNEDTLGRKIRGEAWASVQDLLPWFLEFGIDLLPNPESSEQVLP